MRHCQFTCPISKVTVLRHYYIFTLVLRVITKKNTIWERKRHKILEGLSRIGQTVPIEELNMAWIALNTRTVFLKTDNLGSDPDREKQSWALAPFLDCLNHSPDAKIETRISDYFEIVACSGMLEIIT